MISTFHLRAFIAACIVLLFAALIPQGFASSTKTPCDTCVATSTNGWCIKDYGAEMARNCVAKDVTDSCLGGKIPEKCPDAPVAYPTTLVTDLVADPNTCAACKAAGGKWCTKPTTPPLRQCIISTKTTDLCGEPGAEVATTCAVPLMDHAEQTVVLGNPATNYNACRKDARTNRWCHKIYRTTWRTFCVAAKGIGSTSCLGGTALEYKDVRSNIYYGVADHPSCSACRTATDVWCVKDGGNVRTCMSEEMIKRNLCNDLGDKVYTTCLNMDATTTGKVDIAATATTTAFDECVKVPANSWCMKDFGTAKSSYCVETEKKAIACLGGTAVRVCTAPDLRQTAVDKKNCDECEKAKQNWCIKGAGSDQVRACVPKADATACTDKEITLCSKITVANEKLPTSTVNTTKSNRASTFGVSAVPIFTVLGAITVLG